MSLMEQFKELAPTWTNRRQVIKSLLIFFALLIVGATASVVAISVLGKFGVYVAAFFIITQVLSFISMLGIVGSYIFGARWENKDFFDLIKNVVPTVAPEVAKVANVVESKIADLTEK